MFREMIFKCLLFLLILVSLVSTQVQKNRRIKTTSSPLYWPDIRDDDEKEEYFNTMTITEQKPTIARSVYGPDVEDQEEEEEEYQKTTGRRRLIRRRTTKALIRTASQSPRFITNVGNGVTNGVNKVVKGVKGAIAITDTTWSVVSGTAESLWSIIWIIFASEDKKDQLAYNRTQQILKDMGIPMRRSIQPMSQLNRLSHYRNYDYKDRRDDSNRFRDNDYDDYRERDLGYSYYDYNY